MLNFCAAGETLLSEELIPIIQELLDEGHYCMIVTNGTITPKFNQLAKFSVEQRKRLFIKFSYHYLELKRLNLLNVFFSNVKVRRNFFARSVCGSVKNWSGGASSQIFPPSRKITRSATARANCIS